MLTHEAANRPVLLHPLSDATVDREAAAFEHSVAALALTAAELLGDPMPSIRWQTMCAEAQLAFDEIPYPSGKPRQFPAALRAWVQSTPQSAAS